MRQGFSLVELSIVLVILGLLTGGILAGQSLIRAAELRSVSTDIARYKTSLMTFRDKYFALPGDFTKATSFWGDQATGTGACASAATADGTPGTCNGNGDGKIEYGTNWEANRSWQQLAMAGLIEGTYSGIGLPDTPGTNIPRSRIGNAGFALYWMIEGGSLTTDMAQPNRFLFGLGDPGNTTAIAALKPEETWNIDTKNDDGLAGSGTMIAVNGSSASGTCVTGTAYTLSNSGVACRFSFKVD